MLPLLDFLLYNTDLAHDTREATIREPLIIEIGIPMTMMSSKDLIRFASIMIVISIDGIIVAIIEKA